MYKLYCDRSPNVDKVALFLEEADLEWDTIWIDVAAGVQHSEEFLRLSPNGKVPVLLDDQPEDGGAPAVVWESGAILLYLAEKTGKFLSRESAVRRSTLQWLFWQMAGLGPMSGQNAHFIQFSTMIPPSEYAADRYRNENRRLLTVLDRQLRDDRFIAGEFSIADMACFPWARIHGFLGVDIGEMPSLGRWLEELEARPATARAQAKIASLPATDVGPQERYRTLCLPA